MTNFDALALRFASLKAVPRGGGLADGLRWFTYPSRMKADLAASRDEARRAIEAVKAAPDNPYGDDDEAIAGEILRRVRERRASQ